MSRIDDAIETQATSHTQGEELRLSLYVSHNPRHTTIRKLKDRLDEKCWSDIDPKESFFYGALPLYQLSENKKKERSKFLCRKSRFPWIIQPNTSLTWSWETFVLLEALFVALVYPYFIAFYGYFPGWLESMSICVDAINLLDIYIILTTAVVQRARTIDTVMGILNYRLNTVGFYFDVFSVFFIEVFSFLMHSDHMFYVLKLNRLLKSYRICKYFHHIEENITINIFGARMLKYAIYLIMCPYWCGALLYFETCFEGVCEVDGWFHMKRQLDLEKRLLTPCTDHPVLISVYYALSALSLLAYGDISPGNMKDIIIVCIGAVVGK